jgi:hypothetical protein
MKHEDGHILRFHYTFIIYTACTVPSEIRTGDPSVSAACLTPYEWTNQANTSAHWMSSSVPQWSPLPTVRCCRTVWRRDASRPDASVMIRVGSLADLIQLVHCRWVALCTIILNPISWMSMASLCVGCLRADCSTVFQFTLRCCPCVCN